MAWYRNGTVTVTNGSTTVTGSGTAFVANVKIGEGFLGPEGRVYEIADIPSNTELTLATAYTGATAGAQAYAILPTQSALADLAEQAAELVNSFAVVRDGVGQGLFADGSAAVPGIRFANDQDTGIFRPGANFLGISVGGAERLRASSAGVTVGASTTNYDLGVHNNGTLGFAVGRNLNAANEGTAAPLLQIVSDSTKTRVAGYGDGLTFWTAPLSGTLAERARLTSDGKLGIGTGLPQHALSVAGIIAPSQDNTYSFGTASLRASVVYAGTGTINTSDERDKTWRGTLTDAEYLAGCTVLDELGFYQFNEVIDEKGLDGARYHFGVRAQQVWAAFAAQDLVDPIGVDGKPGATPYGFLCFDEWEEETAPVLDEEGEPTGATTIVREAGFRYGIRPDELALFLIAVQARRQAELDGELAAQAARISALETVA